MNAKEEKAKEIGALYGVLAAGWVFDGNTPEETYRRVLDGLNDIDPEVMDALPSSPLSGEWADDYSVRDLARDLKIDPDDLTMDDMAAAFDDAFYMAVQQEIEAIALKHVPDYVRDGSDE